MKKFFVVILVCVCLLYGCSSACNDVMVVITKNNTQKQLSKSEAVILANKIADYNFYIRFYDELNEILTSLDDNIILTICIINNNKQNIYYLIQKDNNYYLQKLDNNIYYIADISIKDFYYFFYLV